MSYFNLELIKKIKSINCYQLPTSEILGIFKNREISIDGNIISWFNAEAGQYQDKLHYIEFNNSLNDKLIYGRYTEGQFGKTKIQVGSFTLKEAFNIFSIDSINNGLHIVLENEMYKDLKCISTETENKTRYENKIFKFIGTNDGGAINYSTQTGEELLLFFDHELHSWVLANTDAENFTGIETNDNSLFLLAVNDVSNAFNDYFQFGVYTEKMSVKTGKNSTVIRKK